MGKDSGQAHSASGYSKKGSPIAIEGNHEKKKKEEECVEYEATSDDYVDDGRR